MVFLLFDDFFPAFYEVEIFLDRFAAVASECFSQFDFFDCLFLEVAELACAFGKVEDVVYTCSCHPC